MSDFLSTACTAFAGSRLLVRGPLIDVALAVKAAETGGTGPILTFDDATGKLVDFDLRGGTAEIVSRLAARGREVKAPKAEGETRGRGRPKLGVVAREVTLLPRHWEWLAAQPGGASQALRRLVEEARKDGDKGRAKAAQERAYRFMSAMAGDLAGFEEASRALFAGDKEKFAAQAAGWPEDVRTHVLRLAEL
jgi:hypothetical protein